MTEREELLKRLERVKTLAERGIGGEKEHAEALLKRLMEKYDISDEDIEDTSTRTYLILQIPAKRSRHSKMSRVSIPT